MFKTSLTIYFIDIKYRKTNLEKQGKLSNNDLEDYLAPRESPVMPPFYIIWFP